jgi:hypothetical protein
MRWLVGRLIRELPPLTVKVPGTWHVCGTGDRLLRSLWPVGPHAVDESRPGPTHVLEG